MAPTWLAQLHRNVFSRSTYETQADFQAAKAQWQKPGDILTVLMIIGGDIVQRALAQLSGSRDLPLAPVAFSFGWVFYSFSSIMSAIGDGRLMPQPDCSVTLTNVHSGYSRPVNSWILSRLVRDCETRFKYEHGLTIQFLYTSPSKTPGVPDRDWLYYSGIAVIIAQLGIAAIPGCLFGNWMVFILTAAGTVLALVSGALPQWRREKWAARDVGAGARSVVCLTRGNGAKLVLVIVSDGCGLRLEDLAAARTSPSRDTIVATVVLGVLWLAHLLTIICLKDDAWYPLAVGALGMVQNGVAAGARRMPSALGFHFNEAKTKIVHEKKVFDAIKEAEAVEANVGVLLVDTFFPGGALRPDEELWLKSRRAERQALS
ncbi:hypothetical protein BOTBODRAFT_36070 [Botryobasidium botryosum FD-172 SS1]|uniref:Uncharacterized protein n=1 Tax=Botryobasidium botryosum (strain FD-172 SS1) TaxID=930990 RepID=A0A067M434_BOTB1|nr:hypothetical protein BOTBODRAFT_36070 [Botryobasidium botryosum FD-172 SS1]